MVLAKLRGGLRDGQDHPMGEYTEEAQHISYLQDNGPAVLEVYVFAGVIDDKPTFDYSHNE
jgi:hypothetical protein